VRRIAVAILALALVAVPAAFGAKLKAPSKAQVGDKVTAKASGLKSGKYTLRIVADDQPQGARSFCAARLAGPKQTTKSGRVKLRGTIPKKLSCYENNSVRLGKVKVTPGSYHLLVAVQFGPTGSEPKHSFVRRALTIKR
jgi:hypothetical protein